MQLTTQVFPELKFFANDTDPKVKAVLLAPSLAMTTIHVTTMKTTSQYNLSQRLGSNLFWRAWRWYSRPP